MKRMSVKALNDAISKLSPFDHKYGYKQEILIRLRDDKMACEDHMEQQHMQMAGKYRPKCTAALTIFFTIKLCYFFYRSEVKRNA